MNKRICPKCGGEVESDNFCLKCMEFIRFEQEENQDADKQSDFQSSVQSTESKNTTIHDFDGLSNNDQNSEEQETKGQEYFDNNTDIQSSVHQYANDSNVQSDQSTYNDNIHRNDTPGKNELRTKTPLSRYIIAFAFMAGIIIVGVVLLKVLQNNSVVTSLQDTIYTEADNKNQDSDSSLLDLFSEETSDSTEASIESTDDYTITDADYNEIIEKGEPSTYYNLYDIQADDMVSELNDYISSVEDGEVSYDDQNSDNYVITFNDGTEYTCYETYDVWSYEDGTNDIFYLIKDTVTGNLLGVGAECKDFNRAVGLMTEAFGMVEGGISKDDKTYLTEEFDKNHKDEETSFEYLDQLFYGIEDEDGYICFEMYLK